MRNISSPALILPADTQFISLCVCSFFLQQLSGQEVIYSPQLFNHLTDTTAVRVLRAERMPPGEVRCKYFTLSPAWRGCEPQVLRESSCNILFVYHISKSPATWEGNNWVQNLLPLSTLIPHSWNPYKDAPPPPHKNINNLDIVQAKILPTLCTALSSSSDQGRGKLWPTVSGNF